MTAPSPYLRELDQREFIRWATETLDHPKYLKLSHPFLSLGLAVGAASYIKSKGTDGLVPMRYLAKSTTDAEGPIVEIALKEMVQVGIFHDSELTSDECDRCNPPAQGTLVLHDVGYHQLSRAHVAELSEKRSRAGAAGAAKRWAKHNERKAAAAAKAEIDEPESEELTQQRADAERLCNFMADWMARKHTKGTRPRISPKWREDMLGLVRAGYDVEQIKNTISWIMRDRFEVTVVRSPGKLADRFEVVLGKMQNNTSAPTARRGGAPSGPLNVTGQNDLFDDDPEDAP